jgi:hypothetical protein
MALLFLNLDVLEPLNGCRGIDGEKRRKNIGRKYWEIKVFLRSLQDFLGVLNSHRGLFKP